MTIEKKLDAAAMPKFTGSETFYRFGLLGDVLFAEDVKYVADTAGACWLLDIISNPSVYEPKVWCKEF